MHLRQIFKFTVVAFSLASCAATVAMWRRSISAVDVVSYSRGTSISGRYARVVWELKSSCGFIGITRGAVVPVDDAAAAWLVAIDNHNGLGWSKSFPAEEYEPEWKGFVDSLKHLRPRSAVLQSAWAPEHWSVVEIPYCVPLLLFSLPADIALYRLLHARRARRRAARNHCPACDYDLRATPGRCPECGREATPPS